MLTLRHEIYTDVQSILINYCDRQKVMIYDWFSEKLKVSMNKRNHQ